MTPAAACIYSAAILSIALTGVVLAIDYIDKLRGRIPLFLSVGDRSSGERHLPDAPDGGAHLQAGASEPAGTQGLSPRVIPAGPFCKPDKGRFIASGVG
jgi:hypothetical protein